MISDEPQHNGEGWGMIGNLLAYRAGQSPDNRKNL